MGFDKQYDSVEEKWFDMYLSELKHGGWVEYSSFHPHTLEIFDGREGFIYVIGKKEPELVKVKLLGSQKYTPDWVIKWTDKANGVFTWRDGGVYPKSSTSYHKNNKDNYIPFYTVDHISCVDVKGGYVGENNTSGTTFPKNQALTMLTHNVYVQKVVVSLDEKGLFHKTFFPRNVVTESVYKRDYKEFKAGDTKIKVPITLLETWVKRKQHGGNFAT